MWLNQLKQMNGKILDQVKKQFVQTIPKYQIYLNNLKSTNKEVIIKKITNLNNWYTQILGLDEVRQFQERVVQLQEKLLTTQEKRREVGKQLAEIRRKSNQLQDEIHKVRRQEDLEKFLNLMKEETEVIRMENETLRTFQNYDLEERELFTAFTNAVRDSHEKQRAQLEYTKYFGLILSIAGSFLTFCYSTLKKRDLKVFIDEKLRSNSDYAPSILDLIRKENEKVQNLIKIDLINQRKENLNLIKKEIYNNYKEVRNLVKINGNNDNSFRNNAYIVAGCAFLGLIVLRFIVN